MATDFRDADAVCALLHRAAECLRSVPGRKGATQWIPPRGRLVGTGDLHDNMEHLRAVLSFARLGASEHHHVIVHELIHGETLTGGVDASYRMLTRVAELVVQYPHQVHPLLANHELAQARKLRISKGGGEQVQLFLDGLDWVFGDDAGHVSDAVDEFIYAMPIALRTEQGVFCSHSTPGPADVESSRIDALERDLAPEEYDDQDGVAWQYTWGRGQTPESAARLAQRLDARLLMCGHAHVEDGAAAVGDALLLLNSDHARGVAVELALDGPPPAAPVLAADVHYLAMFGLEL